MICLTRLNHKAFYLNSDLIEMVEETPDTLITMTTGKKFLVEDSAESVLEKVIQFRNRCFYDVTTRIETNSKQKQWDPHIEIIEGSDWVNTEKNEPVKTITRNAEVADSIASEQEKES